MKNTSTVRRHAAILVLLGSALFLWRLGSHDLWPPDEPRFAMQAWEMRARGDYVVPTLNGNLNTEKPPFMFWAIDAFALVRGDVDEWAARLPSAVSAILLLLLVYGLGSHLYDPRTGFYGALIFATSTQVLEKGRWASADMTLTMLSLAAIVLLWRGATGPDAHRLSIVLAWGSMGLATLVKGPVGLVVPLLAVVPPLALLRQWRALLRLVPIAGVGLYALVVLSWYGPLASRIGLEEVWFALNRNNVQRYVDATNFRHPFWHYLWRFPLGFLPWIFFLPSAIRDGFRGPDRGPRWRSAVFLVTWFASIFLFFSLASGKRGVYIFALYPAASVLVAALFARLAGESRRPGSPRPLLAPSLVWAGIAATLVVLLPLAAQRNYPPATWIAVVSGGVLFAGATGAAILAWKGRAPLALASLTASMVMLSLFLTETLLPRINEIQNVRGWVQQFRAHLSPEIPFATTEEKRDAWVFYTRRIVLEVNSPDEVRAYLAGPGPRDLLIPEEELEEVGPLPEQVQMLASGTAGRLDYYLLRKLASPDPGR